jgi:type III pantothenate kinase
MGAAYLLINNNNSRTKFALADPEALRPERAVAETATLDEDVLRAVTAGWSYERVVLASVVPRKAEVIRNVWAGRPLIEVNHRVRLGISLDFPDPSVIGADRLANAVAMAGQFAAAPSIAVDFGTAVTFDILSAERAYVGGIIAPGLSAMTDYMHERTALLPKIEIEEPPSLIGKSTRGAMLSGAVHGYRGLVKEILLQLEAELTGGREHVFTVATGGYAELISAKIPAIDAVLPDLTLDGMRIVANLNPP